MEERERERETVIVTDRGGNGSTGAIIAVILLLVVLAVLYFTVGQDLMRGSAAPRDVNIDLNLPGGNSK